MRTFLFFLLVSSSFTLAGIFWKRETKMDTQATNNDPEKRVAHTITYLNDIKRTVLLDGYHRPDKTPLQGDMWTWDGRQWEITAGNGPRVTFNSSAAYDSRRKKLVLFGGMLATGADEAKNINDTWEWDATNGWKKPAVSNAPAARMCQAIAYDSERGKTVMYGGAAGFGKTAFDDTWEWDGNNWKQIKTAHSPGGLCEAAMVYDSRRKTMVLFGGQRVKSDEDAARKDSGETWEWNGSEWKKIADKGPSPRIQHKMVFDVRSSMVLLYGGNRKNKTGESYTIMGDMWAWDGSEWKQMPNSDITPGKRCMHAMTYDDVRYKTILYGGGNGERVFGDTWEWDGKNWNKVFEVAK